MEAAPHGPCCQRPARPGSLGWMGGRQSGCTCRVMVSSGCAGTQSSPRPGPQALEDRCRRSGTRAAAALWWASGPSQGPRPALALGPPAGWAPAGTACTALRSSCGEEGAGQVRTPGCQLPASPAPSPAVSEAHFQESSPNSLTMKNVCWLLAIVPDLDSNCIAAPVYPGKIALNVHFSIC